MLLFPETIYPLFVIGLHSHSLATFCILLRSRLTKLTSCNTMNKNALEFYCQHTLINHESWTEKFSGPLIQARKPAQTTADGDTLNSKRVSTRSPPAFPPHSDSLFPSLSFPALSQITDWDGTKRVSKGREFCEGI